MLWFRDGDRETRCLYPSSGAITLRCSSEDFMIEIKSAYYARLTVDTPGFCQWLTLDPNRGDCVPHAEVDRASIARSCNTYNSCVFQPRYDHVLPSCRYSAGQIYVNVEFDCITRAFWLILHRLPQIDVFADKPIRCLLVRGLQYFKRHNNCFYGMYIIWHRMWVDCGRPRNGIVAEVMRKTRAQYHDAIQKARREEDNSQWPVCSSIDS